MRRRCFVPFTRPITLAALSLSLWLGGPVPARASELSAFVSDVVTSLSLASPALDCSSDPATELGSETASRLAILNLQKAKTYLWRYTLSERALVQLAANEMCQAFDRMIRQHREMMRIAEAIRLARISDDGDARRTALADRVRRWTDEVAREREHVLHATVIATHALSGHGDPATEGQLCLTASERTHAIETVERFFPESTSALQAPTSASASVCKTGPSTAATAAALIRQALRDLPARDEPPRAIVVEAPAAPPAPATSAVPDAPIASDHAAP